VAKFSLDQKSVSEIVPPLKGNRIDYDLPTGLRDKNFVRGFAIRTTAAGLKTFLLVYVTATGVERRQRIGDFGPHSVTTARDEARRLRGLVDAGRDPFAEKATARAQAQDERARSEATFGNMLLAYCARLRQLEKPSAAKVEAELRRTIETPFPAIWKKSAASVALDDLVRITSALVDAGKLRQAEKTRSYVRAAYGLVTSAKGRSGAEDLVADFSTVTNLARDLATVERPKKTGDERHKRDLPIAELAAYWKRIKSLPTRSAALLRLHLLTGAQRCEQLSRLTKAGVDLEGRSIRLYDIKGKRREARVHVVPLVPEAMDAAKLLMSGEGEFVFSFDGGVTGASYQSFREAVRDVGTKMVEAGESPCTFTPGELRITVETRLAALGVSRETRAQLQSHGLFGVQDKHYDKHTYMDEKRAALETLRSILEPGRKVVQMRKRA